MAARCTRTRSSKLRIVGMHAKASPLDMTGTTPEKNGDTRTRRILVVEDEETLAAGVREALELQQYAVETRADGKAGLDRIREGGLDLVILDLMLPGMGGLEVLKHLRAEGRDVRVVILTALASEQDLVRGFELGADDYVKKPFSPRELLARVEAQFRRSPGARGGPADMLELPGGIKVDLKRLEVHRDGGVVQLTPREGDILEYLMKNRSRVVTRDDLLLDVWHYKSANVETRTVDIHIVGLRRKVEPNPAQPTFIQTVRGKGYRWFDD
jgi:DNA-binding response OmpR family regulator